MKLLYIRYNLFARTQMLSLSVYEPIATKILLWGTVPDLGEGVELGVECGTASKLITMGIICLMKPKRYLASFRSYMNCKFWFGDVSPNRGKGCG